MNKREQILLVFFGVLLLLIVGGGGLAYLLKSYHSIHQENNQLQSRIENSQILIEQGKEWKVRSNWIEEKVPTFGSRQQASAHLLDVAQLQADAAKLDLGSKELLNESAILAGSEEDATVVRTFATTAVRVKFPQAEEMALMSWLESLQKPIAFIGVTYLLLTPATEGKKVSGEVELTLYFRERAPNY